MIKESGNFIGQETQLSHPTKSVSLRRYLFDGYLNAKKIKEIV